MKPPPVTQQPPLEGGTQSSVVVSGTHAPHALGWLPSLHCGGWVQATRPSSVSQVKGGGWSVPPSEPSPGGFAVPPSEPSPGGFVEGGGLVTGGAPASEPPLPGGLPGGLPPFPWPCPGVPASSPPDEGGGDPASSVGGGS